MDDKCKHGRDSFWCVDCRYGHTGHHHESKNPEEPRDLVDELKHTSNYRKLKEFWIDE